MFYFLKAEFWNNPLLVAMFIVSLVAVIFARYLVVAIMYKVVLNLIARTLRNSFKENSHQIKREIKWAFLSSIVFTALCAVSLFLYQYNLTAIYTQVDEYSVMYFVLSPILVLSLYESYYYWLHRWMHTPPIFKIVHKVHHESSKPTVFTAFSFHPLEAFLQFLFFPLIIIIIPIHLSMLGFVFALLTVCAVINHGGFEIYSARIRKHVIGAAHHDRHHRDFRKNFGLTFTWWDKLMNTESSPE